MRQIWDLADAGDDGKLSLGRGIKRRLRASRRVSAPNLLVHRILVIILGIIWYAVVSIFSICSTYFQHPPDFCRLKSSCVLRRIPLCNVFVSTASRGSAAGRFGKCVFFLVPQKPSKTIKKHTPKKKCMNVYASCMILYVFKFCLASA